MCAPRTCGVGVLTSNDPHTTSIYVFGTNRNVRLLPGTLINAHLLSWSTRQRPSIDSYKSCPSLDLLTTLPNSAEKMYILLSNDPATTSFDVPGTNFNVHLRSWYTHRRPSISSHKSVLRWTCWTTLPNSAEKMYMLLSNNPHTTSIYVPGTNINVHSRFWYKNQSPSIFLVQLSTSICFPDRNLQTCWTTSPNSAENVDAVVERPRHNGHLRSWYKFQCPSTFLVQISMSIYFPGTIIKVHLFCWYISADLLDNVAELRGEDVYAVVKRPCHNVHLLS